MSGADLAALARWRVSLAVALATAGGALAGGAGAGPLFAATAGSLLLCAGVSALNQVQERDTDARMRRTRGRPLPSGRIAPRAALILAALLGACGLGLYVFAGGARLLSLGIAVPLLYNGLYTPLKRATPLCMLVGGVAGALPPLAGWLAAGRGAGEPVILCLFAALYLWQTPHFWRLAERHAADYRAAALPLASDTLPGPLYRGLLVLWNAASLLCLMLGLALAGLPMPLAAAPLLAGGALLLLRRARPLPSPSI